MAGTDRYREEAGKDSIWEAAKDFLMGIGVENPTAGLNYFKANRWEVNFSFGQETRSLGFSEVNVANRYPITIHFRDEEEIPSCTVYVDSGEYDEKYYGYPVGSIQRPLVITCNDDVINISSRIEGEYLTGWQFVEISKDGVVNYAKKVKQRVTIAQKAKIIDSPRKLPPAKTQLR